MVRYTLLRFLVFFGCLCVLWFVPALRADKVLLVALSAVASLAVSWVVLRPFRQEAATQLAERVGRRQAAHEDVGHADADAEDAELDRAENPPDDFR